jgi:hypothetical protein
MQISLVCAECLKTTHPERCNHKVSDMPRWLSSQKMETIRALMADDPAMLLRESMGVSAETTTRAFNETHIAKFIERPREAPTRGVSHIYISVDPAGGGSSNFAIASLCLSQTGSVVVRCSSVHKVSCS